MIYFILNEQNNHVKIGFSKNPVKRLGQLQTSCSHDLKLLLEFHGDTNVEKYLHNKFKKYHVKNEWFEYDESIKKLIDYLQWYNFILIKDVLSISLLDYLKRNTVIDFLNIYFDLIEMNYEWVYNIFLCWYNLKMSFNQKIIEKEYGIYKELKSFEEEILSYKFLSYKKEYFIKLIFYHRIDYRNIINIALNTNNFRTVTDIFHAKF